MAWSIPSGRARSSIFRLASFMARKAGCVFWLSAYPTSPMMICSSRRNRSGSERQERKDCEDGTERKTANRIEPRMVGIDANSGGIEWPQKGTKRHEKGL